MTDKMLFDPTRKERMQLEYPEIQRFPELVPRLHGRLDGDTMFRWVAYMVDNQSPYAKVRDFEERGKMILKDLGVVQQNRFTSDLMSWIEGADRDCRAMMTRYFIIMSAYDYEMWYSMKVSFHNIMEQMRMPIKPGEDAIAETEKRMKLAEKVEQLGKRIGTLEAKLFKDERLRGMLIEQASNNMRRYAEEYAQERT